MYEMVVTTVTDFMHMHMMMSLSFSVTYSVFVLYIIVCHHACTCQLLLYSLVACKVGMYMYYCCVNWRDRSSND